MEIVRILTGLEPSLGFYLGFPIGIPLSGIARNECFRLRYFIALNCAIIAKKEEIIYSQNCAELHARSDEVHPVLQFSDS